MRFFDEMSKLAGEKKVAVGTKNVAEEIDRTIVSDFRAAYEEVKRRIREKIIAGDRGTFGYVPLAHAILTFSPEEYDLSPYREKVRFNYGTDQHREFEMDRISGTLYYNYVYDGFFAEDIPSRLVRKKYKDIAAEAKSDGIRLRLIACADGGRCDVYLGYHFDLDSSGKKSKSF